MIRLARSADGRRTETLTGVMTTLASPTLGGSERLSLWRVVMPVGSTGPSHRIDSEQLWTVLSGRVGIGCDGTIIDVEAGDTVVIPGGVERQISAREETCIIVCGFADAVASVVGEDAPRGTPAWIA